MMIMNLASYRIYPQCKEVKYETAINSKISLHLIALIYLFIIQFPDL